MGWYIKGSKLMISEYEKFYIETLRKLVSVGAESVNRTKDSAYVYPYGDLHFTHDMRTGYPLMNHRKFIAPYPMIEMDWIYDGDHNIQYLLDHGCPFWTAWMLPNDITKSVIKADYELADEYCKLENGDKDLSIYSKRKETLNNVSYLEGRKLITDAGVHLYKEVVVAKRGDVGPIYGVMGRHWPNPDGTEFDQLKYLIETIVNDSTSRRVVVNYWNPSYLPDPKLKPHENVPNGNMTLTPCHYSFNVRTFPMSRLERYLHMVDNNPNVIFNTFEALSEDALNKFFLMYKVPERYLDLSFVMRSNDWILGQPANMNMYASSLMRIAAVGNFVPRFLGYTGFDVHLYSHHLEGAKEILRRYDSGELEGLGYPTVTLNKDCIKGDTLIDKLCSIRYTDFKIENYTPLSHIKGLTPSI